jgi:leucyl-tRNA synthetase
MAAEDFSEKEKIYVLAEFPYPSGSGLHIGHTFTFTGADVYARFQRMQGKNVLFPMGWDAFGLPTENYALLTGRKPQDVTLENTRTYEKQMRELGFSFDWDRQINTTDPSYYKWTQWIFIKLFEKGLAVQQEMPINWCPSCKVGLANEEVIAGRCERCGTEAVRRRIRQWVVKITEYADRLISGLEQTQFIEKVKAAQINWIGRSEGAKIRFTVPGMPESLEVFTTRPDTLWGCTFLITAPEHPLAEEAALTNPDVARYIQDSLRKSELERIEEGAAKTGVFSGLYALHPFSGEELPVWVSDFVLPGYGTGAIMAVPAHDERDHHFARQYHLPIRPIIQPEQEWDFTAGAYSGLDGKLFNSGPLNGLEVQQAIPAAIGWLEDNSAGERAVSYHLRDWIFSRQHYWGEPIPLIHCQQCGWVPVPEGDLPVVLPEVERYEPTDTGESPLANIPEWVNTACPSCGGPGRRETDTMPNWAGSNWYFLRFTDPHCQTCLADPEKMAYWLPVDLYIGGDEHNTLHLLYSRFVYQFLYDLGIMPQAHPEPYRRRVSHGVILGSDGLRMSKSRGSVIIPDQIVSQYGADVVRTYLMFIGPFDATMAWNERAMNGVRRFLDKFERFVKDSAGKHPESTRGVRFESNRIIRAAAEDISALKFNTAIAKIMEGLNAISAPGEAAADADLAVWVQVLAPFIPFTAEKIWHSLGKPGSVHDTSWPEYDPTLEQEEKLVIPVQVNGRLRGTLWIDRDESQASIQARAQELESVSRFLQQGVLRKVIYVAGRTINFVVEEKSSPSETL